MILAPRWWWCMAWPNVVGMESAAIVPAQSKASNIMGNITALTVSVLQVVA